MPTFQNKGAYLLVEINEPYSVEMISSAIHEVTAYCREQNLNKALVDMRNMPGSPSILDRHLHGIEVAKEWGSRIKAALILRPENLSHMTENTAINRGANLLSTSDVAHALEWLGIENK
jgi:predicted N-formylglutamate amidohydrolase